MPELTTSNSSTPDDSLWGAYLDYSFTPQSFDSAPYLFPGQELVPLTVAEGSVAGGSGNLGGEKHGLIDIEELLAPKKPKVDYISTAAGENLSAPLPALDHSGFSSEEGDDVEDDEPATVSQSSGKIDTGELTSPLAYSPSSASSSTCSVTPNTSNTFVGTLR